MATATIHCPECGAPSTFRGATVTLVCEYCGSTIVRTGADVTLLGKVSAILDNGSPILLGGRGQADGVPFEVVGRLQLRHLRGTWNEWYVLFEGDKDGWLADAQGSFYLVRRAPGGGGLPPYESLEVGQRQDIAGTAFTVVERRRARYQGAEGNLPFEAAPGHEYASVDLLTEAGEFATLDYADGPLPTVYRGRAVTLTELRLQPLRRFEGWDG